MAGYKGFRNKRWNKSGCDPYNNGIPAKLYGCDEEWRYAPCKLLKPNPQNYRVNDFSTVSINVEGQECKPDGYIVYVWDVLTGTVKEYKFFSRDLLLTELEPGHEYKFYVVGFRELDGSISLSKPSDVMTLNMIKKGAYNKLLDGLCRDSDINNDVECSDYLEF